MPGITRLSKVKKRQTRRGELRLLSRNEVRAPGRGVHLSSGHCLKPAGTQAEQAAGLLPGELPLPSSRFTSQRTLLFVIEL